MMGQGDDLQAAAEALFERAAASFIRAAEAGRHDSFFAGQLQALVELGLIDAARVEPILRPGAHGLCGCGI